MAASPVPSQGASEFVALTKADLHLHLVGSAAAHTVAALAASHPEAGVPADLEELRSFYAFSDFGHFLRVYSAVSSLVRTGDDLLTLVAGLADDLAEQGTAYAEVTVTPYAHHGAGIASLDLGARRARDEKGIELAYVYDISTFDREDGARFTPEAALRHAPGGLVGFGLGGPEDGVRRVDYAPYFAAARAAGLHSVPHASESVGPSEVYAALDLLSAERIGHGSAAASDDRLLARLVDEGITLEICPSSATWRPGSSHASPSTRCPGSSRPASPWPCAATIRRCSIPAFPRSTVARGTCSA